MKGKLIVIDGVSASGKKTQTRMLVERLSREGVKAEKIHFPTYNSTPYGGLVSNYLKGEFGPRKDIPPEIAAIFYAIDRYQLKDELFKKLEHGVTLVLDRYSQSNYAYQTAELNGDEKRELKEWLLVLESRLPQADAVVFIDVPLEVTQQLLKERDVKNELLKPGETDIHESDRLYEAKVRDTYLELANELGWIVVNGASGNELKSREDIHREIYRALKNKGVL
ncbi:MAG: thymidylate kinase [Candidatus Micrarchaeota archaeon]